MADELSLYADENFIFPNGIRIRKSNVSYIVQDFFEENSGNFNLEEKRELDRIIENPELLPGCSMMERIKYLFVRYVDCED